MGDNDIIRITRLETNEANMAKEISDIKKDIKEIKDDITDLRISFGRWSTGIVVAVSTIQFLIQLFLKYSQ